MNSIRDEWGVPHIAAESELEAFRTLGYAQAEDHLPRILRHYAMARAEAASQLGPEWVPCDRSQHRWQHFAAAQRQFALLSARDRALYDSFIAGIQAYMADHPEEQEYPAVDLHPALPIAVYRMFLWHFMVVDAFEAAAAGGVLDPEVAEDLAATVNLNESASNEIVILPEHTVEGATIVVSDPHGPIDGFPMFEYRLRAGRFDVTGVAAPGALPPILGHTSGVGWGSTTGAPRVSDCYLLPTRAEGREYQSGDKWLPVRRRTISIDVAGAEAVIIDLDSVTLNGIESPVIGHAAGQVAAACTPYMAESMPSMDATLLGWAAAGNLAAFATAAATMSMFPSNIMAGDRHGDALYVRLGLPPVRPAGLDVTRPLKGYGERTRWQGYHDFKELVQVGNPACGYMHNNNVAPDTMFPGAAHSDLNAAHYPSYLFNDLPGRTHDRGLRTEEVLSAGPVSVDAVVALALSDRWPTAPRWRDALASAAGATTTDGWREAESTVLRELLDFDGDAYPESTGALAYHYWRTSIPLIADPQSESPEVHDGVWRVPTGASGERYPQSRALWQAVEAVAPLSSGQQRILVEAVRLATRRLLDDIGGVDASLGDVFRIGRGGQDWPARSVAFPAYVPEGEPVVDFVMPLRAMAAGPQFDGGRRRIVSGGRSFRVVAFTNPIRSYSVVLYGQSGRPESLHYADQCALYSEGRAREIDFASALPTENEVP